MYYNIKVLEEKNSCGVSAVNVGKFEQMSEKSAFPREFCKYVERLFVQGTK